MSPNNDWVDRLIDWFKGVEPAGRLPATSKQLKLMKETFDYNKMPWNIRDYINAYNNGSSFNKETGMFTFTPISDNPVRIFTDATPPVEMLKTILDSKKLQVIGDKQLLNVKAYNPKNEIIKVIDASNSKKALSDWQDYQNILRFIGNMARTEYKDLSILVTVYKPDIDKVQEYFKNHFPDEAARIKVAQMVKGVNEYEETNVQFVLAGIHLHHEQAAQEAWELKNICNFWATIKKRDKIKNDFPLPSNSDSLRKPIPVRVNQLLDDGSAYLCEYPELKDYVPEPYWEGLADEKAIGETQQSIRLRFKDNKPKVIWFWSWRYLPGILFTKITTESECFSQFTVGS